MNLKIAAFFGEPVWLDRVYSPREKDHLQELCHFIRPIINLANFDSHLEYLRHVEVIFCTWTMPRLESYHLDQMPALRAVFYAAGSVKPFAEQLLERNILVFSAYKLNAIPTAEFAFAQILLSMKGCFRNQREYRDDPEGYYRAYCGPGNSDESVALLGMGEIGSRVAGHLKLRDVRILAYDPYLSDERALNLGVEPVTLEEAFARAFVVSNHMPHLPETEGIITKELLASMRPNATFINTARGIIVDQPGMISVLRRRPDLQVLLDVSYPEPPDKDSPLFKLPDVFLTSHIAGAVNNERHRLARACIQEFLNWQNGLPLEHAILADKVGSLA